MALHLSAQPRPAPRRGFTLIEMLVVIAIILVLVIATLPRIKYALDESKVRESSRQLSSHISLAKSRASSTGRLCGLLFMSEQIGTPGSLPPNSSFQCTQLYLAEVPPVYSGDVLDARVYVTAPGTSNPPTLSPMPNGPPWDLNFVNFAGTAGSLMTFFQVGDAFAIRFDHKGPLFPATRTNNGFQITGFPIAPFPGTVALPPAATGTVGYSYEVYRTAQRIGAPLNLPRGTVVDFGYSGFGTNGANFYASQNFVLVLFSSDGHVSNVTYQTRDNSNNLITITDDAPGTLHFLVGRPEKVLSSIPNRYVPDANIYDSNALWVSIGRLTGSVTTADNAPNAAFVFTTPPPSPAVQLAEQQAFLTLAREFAITQDVKGGR